MTYFFFEKNPSFFNLKFARLKYKLYLCIVESSTTDRTSFRKTKNN